MTDHVVPGRQDTQSDSRLSPVDNQPPERQPTRRAPPDTADAIARAMSSAGPADAAHTTAPRAIRATTSPTAPLPAVSRRIQRAAYPHGSGEVVAKTFDTRADFANSVEELLDNTFIGIRALFTAGGVATSVNAWGELLHGLLAEDYDMGDYTASDCEEVVENLKAEHRKEQFLQISEFHGYFADEYDPPIWTLDALKGQLRLHHVVVDEDGKDDATLQALLDARGDRTSLEEEPQRLFQFGTDEESLDIGGLKAKLDRLLGSTVNWGHEITDCMDDSGKRGEMYYYQSGSPLIQVGTSAQSHASSQGGRTIIWERSGSTTEILAIGKHTTRADTKLSRGASYEIERTFSPTYNGYTGKIIGFKA
jgi:hypothetical protein